MAFQSIKMQHFRNMAEQTFAFGRRNTLRGKNGSCKSTLKEAMAFVFAGTDSLGNKNPQHLISWDQPATEVMIQTDKAILTRRLTSKGAATIKLTRGDVTTPMSQQQIDTLIGGTDVFLSTLIPGYFFGLPPEKQQKVLTDLLPPTDRKKLGVKELPGSLAEALNELDKDEVIKAALGETLYEAFTRAKWAEWDDFRLRVSDYEIERYLEQA